MARLDDRREHQSAEATVDQLWVVVQGLRTEQARPASTMSFDRAAARCRDLVERIGLPVTS